MSIHTGHPFAPPPQDRDQGRRLRARLSGTVTVWTTGSGPGRTDRAGLTVTSLLLADGPVWQVLALLDPDSDFYELFTARGVAVVHLLSPGQEHLAQAFAGLAPAPGGPFTLGEWTDTTWGPLLAGTRTWAGVRLAGDTADTQVGWSRLVRCELTGVTVGDGEVLTHHRGRYGRA